MRVQHGLHDLREPPTSSVPALARLLSADDARILPNSLLQHCDSGKKPGILALSEEHGSTGRAPAGTYCAYSAAMSTLAFSYEYGASIL